VRHESFHSLRQFKQDVANCSYDVTELEHAEELASLQRRGSTHYSRVTGEPEITREPADVAKKWQVGGLRAECFFPIQPGEIYGILWALCGVCRTQSESIFVQ
jgi:hypothetical protein